MNNTLLTFGEVMARFEPEPNQFRMSQSLPGLLRVTFAGAESNVAASYSILGGAAKYVTALPNNNPLTDAYIRQMKSLDVDVSGIFKSDIGRFGAFYLETGAMQRPSKVWYDRENSSVALLGPDNYNWDSIFAGVSGFHITGITPAISEKAANTSIAMVKKANELGVKVSLDLNFRKKLWNWRPGTTAKDLANEVIEQMIGYVDIVIGNEEDAHDVLRIQAGESDVAAGKLDIARYPDVAKKICRKFPNIKIVAFTLRESISANHNKWGAMVWNSSTQSAHFAPMKGTSYTPYRMTDIVDRVGGGDSFAASLLFALQDDQYKSNMQDCVDFAVAASCLCHSIKGDFNFVSREEVEALKNGNASGRVSR
jgi:2-dehydro-3-deoxygluconokinase